MSDASTVAFLEVDLDGQKQCFPLAEGLVCRIGRATRNTVVLGSSQVSRDHALVDCPNGKDFYVTDLGSLNGTHVNATRITGPVELSHGDVIGIGEFRLSFRRTVELLDESESSRGEQTAVCVLNEEITVLVADIRDYVGLSSRIAEDKLSEVVGCFFRESGALLKAQGAWGQKYMGDAVMAIWVHDGDSPAGPIVRRALLCAYSIHEIAASFQGRFSLEKPVQLGVALNSGFATLGNLGSDAASDYTALGTTMNKTFRLEAATREVPCDVLLGRATFEFLDPAAAEPRFSPHQVKLKGYELPEPAHSISFDGLGAYLGLSKRTLQL